jgi:hypothetical protein
VLQEFYSKCEVSVRVQGEAQRWYEEFVGVREGCVLSPILFAMYINGLAEEVGASGCAVCLMFADDIVFVAQSKEALQQAFDIAYTYSRKWRFDFNIGKDKSAVMVVGGEEEGDRRMLGDQELAITSSYKYLGVGLDKKMGVSLNREMLLGKAKRNFWRAWGMGMGAGELSAKAAACLWETLVRPVLEYAGELEAGEWEGAELLQRVAGRMVLRVGKGVANEVVLGELDWWTMRGRMEGKRLMYWHKLVGLSGNGKVRRVYREGRERLAGGRAVKGEWCEQTREILRRVGLGEIWENEQVGTHGEWKEKVKVLLSREERRRWREGMIGGKKGAKVKLSAYCRIKENMQKEGYLGERREVVSRMVRLRAGVLSLEVETGRRYGHPRWERICRWCDEEEVEDEVHLIDRCEAWKVQRARMWEAVREKDERQWGRVSGMSACNRVLWIMRVVGKAGWGKVRKALDNIISRRESRGKKGGPKR